MPLHSTESGGLAVVSAPSKAIPPPAKLSPLAGLVASPAMPRYPIDVAESPTQVLDKAPPTPPHLPQTAPAPAQVRTTVYSPEKRPSSPWSGPAAGVAAREVMTSSDNRGTPQSLPPADSGIEGIRELLFGSALQEIRTKVAELQLSLNGEIKRLRESVMSRVDEMASALHRDMIVLREETHSQLAQLKTDIFTAATAISGMRDHLVGVESKARQELSQSVADIHGRIVQQETKLVGMMDNLQEKVDRDLETALAKAMTDLAKKSDVANLLNQVSLMVAGSDPAATSPLEPVAPSAATDLSMDVTDWFRIPDPTLPDPSTPLR